MFRGLRMHLLSSWIFWAPLGLVSEGEAFTIEMSRIMKLGDGEEVAYGYRLIAEAELAPSTVNDMHIACQASKYASGWHLGYRA